MNNTNEHRSLEKLERFATHRNVHLAIYWNISKIIVSDLSRRYPGRLFLKNTRTAEGNTNMYEQVHLAIVV